MSWRPLSFLAFLLTLTAPAPLRADLPDYLKKEEPRFAWKLKDKTASLLGGTVYDLHLVSQIWQGITWEHQLQIYQPKDVAPNATMLLWNTGGNSSLVNTALGMDLATRVKAPVALPSRRAAAGGVDSVLSRSPVPAVTPAAARRGARSGPAGR